MPGASVGNCSLECLGSAHSSVGHTSRFTCIHPRAGDRSIHSLVTQRKKIVDSLITWNCRRVAECFTAHKLTEWTNWMATRGYSACSTQFSKRHTQATRCWREAWALGRLPLGRD